MPVIGITGGIATGKSTFTRALLGYLPAQSFDADRAAHDLLANDPEVRTVVQASFGAKIYQATGEPDRPRLRELVFSDPPSRSRLEGILHPAIRRSWLALAASAQQSGAWLIVDIPLLYETGAEAHCNRVVVVACSTSTQTHRLESIRGLRRDTATNILGAQLDLQTKIKQADHLIWNDSGVSCLENQAELLGNWLRQYYG